MHATVYKCFDIETNKAYAAKVVRENDEEKIEAHRQEFKIVNRLNHKNIVRSEHLFVEDIKGQIIQVMQLVEGREICEQMAEIESYSEKEAMYIFK
mmetsp:Transcript_41212/g.56010  ORF Transcript_41212/g.56010 Transcript_41212/m.56010 type:complete len:96 (-) Transcript_41212:620-907(-)